MATFYTALPSDEKRGYARSVNEQKAILPDLGPAVRDAGREIAKGIRDGFTSATEQLDFARDQHISGMIQGGTAVAVVLLIIGFITLARRK